MTEVCSTWFVESQTVNVILQTVVYLSSFKIGAVFPRSNLQLSAFRDGALFQISCLAINLIDPFSDRRQPFL